MTRLIKAISKDRTDGRYGKQKGYTIDGVTEYYAKNGWMTRIENKKAPNEKTVYLVQSGKHEGFTARLGDSNNFRELGHSKNGESFARKLAKKYKTVQFLD